MLAPIAGIRSPHRPRVPLKTRIRWCRFIRHCFVADPRILLAAVKIRRPRYIAKKKMMIQAGAILIWPLQTEIHAVIHTVGSLVIHTEPDPSVIRNSNGIQVAQEFWHTPEAGMAGDTAATFPIDSAYLSPIIQDSIPEGR